MAYCRPRRARRTAGGSAYNNTGGECQRGLREPGRVTETVRHRSLGLRRQREQCRERHVERQQEDQYSELGAYFSEVSIKLGFIGREVIRNNTGDNTPVTGEEIVYRSYKGGEVKHPKTDMDVPPKVPFGDANKPASDVDRREPFVD